MAAASLGAIGAPKISAIQVKGLDQIAAVIDWAVAPAVVITTDG